MQFYRFAFSFISRFSLTKLKRSRNGRDVTVAESVQVITLLLTPLNVVSGSVAFLKATTTTSLEPHIAKRVSCRIKSTGDPLPRDGARHEHTSVRACARRAARAQLRLRRRVAECVPLRLRAGICGPVEVGVGCAAPGRPATRLPRPAHACAAMWSPDGRAACPHFAAAAIHIHMHTRTIAHTSEEQS